MGLFNFLKSTATQSQPLSITPYTNHSTNLIYNLLFCDDLNLYKENTKKAYLYPFDILFSETSSALELKRIIEGDNSDPRIKILA